MASTSMLRDSSIEIARPADDFVRATAGPRFLQTSVPRGQVAFRRSGCPFALAHFFRAASSSCSRGTTSSTSPSFKASAAP